MFSRFLCGIFFSMLVHLPALGQAPAADVLVKGVTEDVLSVLREDKGLQGDRKRVAGVIEKRIAPHFDFERMTALAVGREWQKISPSQRQALASEFRTLLIRTYSNALATYKNQTVSFKPMRPTSRPDEAVVNTEVEQPGAVPVPIDYRLQKTSGGEWKVYDVIVNNVSLVTTYRGSFATELSNGGVEGLLKSLEGRNRSLETQS